VFWLIAMLASVGIGAASVFVTLQRMGGNFEGLFRAAPDLEPSAFREGAYGKITGVVSAPKPLETPGLGTPSVLYELVVYKTYADTHNTTSWRVAHRAIHGGELEITVGDVTIRIGAPDVYVLAAPSHDANEDLRVRGSEYGRFRSRVRYVPVGATVHIVGTLTREVDADPSAMRDYRETATRYRLIARKKQPLILSCKAHKQLAAGA
jgi:hypothetical protein